MAGQRTQCDDRGFSGLGYVVKVGTPIGANDGKVKAIKPNEIIIEETYVDLFGKKGARSASSCPWRRRNDEVEEERNNDVNGRKI
jgi:Tfp pilus assembly protein PilP